MNKKTLLVTVAIGFSALALSGQGCLAELFEPGARDPESRKAFMRGGLVSESNLPAGTTGWMAKVVTEPLEDIAKEEFGQTKTDSGVLKHKKDTVVDPETGKDINIDVRIDSDAAIKGNFKGSTPSNLIITTNEEGCPDISGNFAATARAVGMNLDNYREMYTSKQILFGFYENEHVKFPVHYTCGKMWIIFKPLPEDRVDFYESIWSVPADILLDRNAV